MSGGSQQLRRFRIAIRAGETVGTAAQIAGIPLGEARLHVAADAIEPPSEDAFRPLAATFCATCARVVCGCPDALWAGRQ